MFRRGFAIRYLGLVAALLLAAVVGLGPVSMLASLALLLVTLPWSVILFGLFGWTIGHNGAGQFWLPFSLAGLTNAYIAVALGSWLARFREEHRSGASMGRALARSVTGEFYRQRLFLSVILVLVLVALIPVKRVLFPAWSVIVVDVRGEPATGVSVGRSWSRRTTWEGADDFSLGPADRRVTDASGAAEFPAVEITHAAFWWVLSYSSSLGHGGLLPWVEGSVSVRQQDGYRDFESSLPSRDDSCQNEECLNRPLRTTIHLRGK
jgi:hypothetical protein